MTDVGEKGRERPSRPKMRFDIPTPEPDTEEFWEACRAHRLLLRKCNECSKVHYYPRPFCPGCWSENVEWIEASGRGRVYTYSIVHRNDLPPWPDKVPYCAAIVELEEGPRMMTNVVECDFEHVAVEMLVELTWIDDIWEDESWSFPVFKPAS
ncbi:MAG: Zn-ribbon domain-containing OB-fold protein [Actinobacteria bacterium ATB1]|nr:Zn-ribbon domain-containing OB-fold protein [Actinobacteria bacterium ATB1]